MENNIPNTALLVMDMQPGVINRLADPQPLINNVAKAIAHARATGIPVIYAVLGFRPGMPEINMDNKIFAASKANFAPVNMDEFMKVAPELTQQDGDITVRKMRFSVFPGNDLEMILRAQNIKHLVLTGYSTSGVVLSTLREAADKDYNLTVLADCCDDTDEEVHRVLTTKIFPRQADVLNVADWAK